MGLGLAFKYSESTYAHWLPLVIADRVGVVEGVLADLTHGHIPNIPGELGLKAEWQHNRKELMTRGVIGAIVLYALITRKRSGKDHF